jgi:hypothetical protein
MYGPITTTVERLNAAVRPGLPALNPIPDSIDDTDIGDVDLQKYLIRAKSRAWRAFQNKKRLKEGHASSDAEPETPLPECILFEEYAKMSELSDWHEEALPEKLPDVIPEWFLWIVFDQLVDAFTMLSSGRINEEDDGTEWDKIVHVDGHLMNIFVKPPVGTEGEEFKPEEKCRYRQFKEHEVRLLSNSACYLR